MLRALWSPLARNTRLAVEFELDADFVQRPGGAINNRVDKTDRHRVGVQRLRWDFAQPLTEELEGFAGIVAHGGRTER